MLMHGTIGIIIQASLSELLRCPSRLVLRQIVQSQNLREVCEVVLADIIAIIFDHVLKGGDRPFPVESTVSVRKNQEKRPAFSNNSFPLSEGAKRVSNMLQTVACQHTVVRGICDRLQVSCFSNELPSRGPGGMKAIRATVLNSTRPKRARRKKAVVSASKDAINRKLTVICKHLSRAADFEGVAPVEVSEIFGFVKGVLSQHRATNPPYSATSQQPAAGPAC